MAALAGSKKVDVENVLGKDGVRLILSWAEVQMVGVSGRMLMERH